MKSLAVNAARKKCGFRIDPTLYALVANKKIGKIRIGKTRRRKSSLTASRVGSHKKELSLVQRRYVQLVKGSIINDNEMKNVCPDCKSELPDECKYCPCVEIPGNA